MAGSTYPFTDGSIITAAGQNQATPVVLVTYTGTDLDFSGSNSNITNTHEITITSADLLNRKYIEINMLIQTDASYTDTTSSVGGGAYSIGYEIETKDVGGSYTTRLSGTLNQPRAGGSYSSYGRNTQSDTLNYIHELTTDEKNNGITIQFSSIASFTIINAGTSPTAIGVWTTKQINIKTIHGD